MIYFFIVINVNKRPKIFYPKKFLIKNCYKTFAKQDHTEKVCPKI